MVVRGERKTYKKKLKSLFLNFFFTFLHHQRFINFNARQCFTTLILISGSASEFRYLKFYFRSEVRVLLCPASFISYFIILSHKNFILKRDFYYPFARNCSFRILCKLSYFYFHYLRLDVSFSTLGGFFIVLNMYE